MDDFFDQVDPARLAAVRYERDRIDSGSGGPSSSSTRTSSAVQRCRRPIIAGDEVDSETSNGETRWRFHQAGATMRGVLSRKRRRGGR